MRLMRDKETRINDSRYMSRNEMVKIHISGKHGIAHVRSAYDAMFKPWAWPGGYPVIFIDDNSNVYCADCARKTFIMENTDITSDIYYEGPAVFCDVCNTEIESAYGDPENP